MASYIVPLLAEPAQNFSAQLGDYLLYFRLQWMVREEVFRVDISLPDDVPLTLGRILNVGADLLSGLYPTPEAGQYGSLIMSGDTPTPDNLGIDNQLVWSNG